MKWWAARSKRTQAIIVIVGILIIAAAVSPSKASVAPAATSSARSLPTATVIAAQDSATPTPTSTAAATPATASTTTASIAPTAAPTAAPTSTSTATPGTGSCHLRGPLPDPICTPGATDPRVTQANISTTICVSGYTATVRPPTSYTMPLERELIARYGLNLTPQQTELDHLIPLELGGDPRDVRNLFPEPYEPRPGAHEKDTIENALHADVCAGRRTLADAQRAIATDWTSAR